MRHLVIVGLGNPGSEYVFTRHNLGYLVVQALANAYGWQFKDEPRFLSRVVKGKIGADVVHLLLPTTYMNESGRAVKLYLDFHKLGTDDVCIVSDDIHLEYGHMRLRNMGSSGGHNGLKSIQAHLHTQHYLRLRMGVGRKEQAGRTLADYVLDRFTPAEREQLPEVVHEGLNLLHRLIEKMQRL